MARIGCILIVSLLLVSSIVASTNHTYVVSRTFKIGGQADWDYAVLDTDRHHLFVSHETAVDVIDIRTGRVVGHAPEMQGARGIALATDLRKGFAASSRDGVIRCFDLVDFHQLGKVQVGAKPDAVLYDRARRQLVAFTHDSNAILINPQTLAIEAHIFLNGSPEFARADKTGHVYVNLQAQNEVLALNLTTGAVEHRWPAKPCFEPTAMAIDTASHRLFVGCHNRMLTVMNYENGKIVANLPIGLGVDAAVFDPKTRTVFASCGGDGTLSLIHEDSPDSFTLIRSVATRRSARTMALDPTTGRIYLPFAQVGPDPKMNNKVRELDGTFAVLEMSPSN